MTKCKILEFKGRKETGRCESEISPERGAKQAVPAVPEHLCSTTLARCSQAVARSFISYELALKLRALPLSFIEVLGIKTLAVATVGKDDRELIQALKFAAGCEVRLTQVTPEVLSEALAYAYLGDQNRLLQSRPKSASRAPVSTAAEVNLNRLQGDISKFLRTILEFAVARQASDIHLTPFPKGALIRLRVKGELLTHDGPICSNSQLESVIRQVKVLSGMDGTITRRPQDGRLSVGVADKERAFRVSTMPTVHGEKIVMRIVEAEIPENVAELGFHPLTQKVLKDLVVEGRGLLLVSGPTGGGKSTTLYCIARMLARRGLNVLTIEDPVEARVTELSQTEISAKENFTYAEGLRAALRQDPDVLLVGEIRDKATAAEVLRIALTGHLVITTIHGGSVYEAILRLYRLTNDILSISEVLKVAMTQRLVPVLCERCRVIDLAGTHRLGFEVQKPVGCRWCDYTGYECRLPVEEMLNVPPYKEQLMGKTFPSSSEFYERVGEGNYLSDEFRAGQLCRAGKIALDDYLRLSRR